MASGNGTILVLQSLAWLRVPQGGGVGERKRRRTTMFRRKAAASATMLVLKSLAWLWERHEGFAKLFAGMQKVPPSSAGEVRYL